MVKNLSANAGDIRDPGFNSSVRKIPWRRAWQSTSVFSSGESPWTEKPGGLRSIESDMTEGTQHTHAKLNHFVVYLKLTHYNATILQYKILKNFIKDD